MKKLLSLVLALTLVFSFCCVFASAEGEAAPAVVAAEGDPEAFLWLKADESFTPGIQFSIPGDQLSDADYRIITNVCFEGCEGEGTAYVNYYVYSKDATGTGDFDHLIQFADFASHKSVGEGWNELEFTFNPTDNLYGKLEGEKITDIGFVTVGIGFWQATGVVKCSSVRLNEGVTVVWSKGFDAGIDLEDESIAYSNLGTEGVNWGIVRPEVVENGNIAKEKTVKVTATGTSSTYNAPLNNGVAATEKSYTNAWFAFTRDASPLDDFRGTESYIGTATFDLGEAKYWNAVRANIWDAAGDSGIASPTAVVVYSSDDNENWTEVGDLTLGTPGTVYWAAGTFDAICSRYVKVAFPWANGAGAFVFTNEIEIIGCDAPIEENFDGDVNKDGKVNSRDAIYLLRAILNPDKYPIDFSGDVNGDGAANTADAIYLLRHVFFPEEYPLITEPIEPAPVPAEGENIAEGKSYTVDEGYTVRADGYGDPDLTKLTDGVKDATGGSAPAGFNGTNANVIIDLGGIGTIDGIITDLQGNNWGIPQPFGYTVNFAVSLDGEEWTDLGAGYMQKVLEQETGWNLADYFVNCDGIEARYVKVNYVTPADYTGNHIWPSEIQVIGTLEEEPIAESPIYVVGEEGVAEVTDEALAKLLDGVYASDATAFSDARLMNINWDAAYDYTAGAENAPKKATIYYNFDEAINVTGIKLGAFKDRNSFVDLPGVKIYLTSDGITYVRAADGAWTSTIDGLANVTEERTGTPVGEAIYTADWSTRAAFSVKGVMIELELVDPFAFLSELEIVTDYVADGALEENIGHVVDTIKLGGVDVAIADATATVITAKSGEMPLDAAATGDFRLARSGVITIAKWDDAVNGYRVTFNEVNGWPNNREGSMPAAADDEIYVFTISSGTIKNAGAGDKWVIWHIEVGDVLYVYDDVIAINHMIDSQPSKNFSSEEPEEPAYQPDPLEELPENAIVIDFAGYKHAAFVSIVAGDNETIAELTARGNGGTAKDMNYAYNILVDKDNKVVDVDFTLGTACTFTCPEGGYIISYNGNKEGYAAMADIKVGAEITLYNIILDPIADLEGNVELTSAGFTYVNPEPEEPIDKGENVALNKDYTIGGTLEGSYPDTDGIELTDGLIPESASYSEPGIVGFNPNSDFYKENGFAQIVVDLGGLFDITEIDVVASNLGNSGVNAPGTVKYAYSTNGTDFTEIGEGKYDKDLSVIGINVINSVKAEAQARYIKVTFTKGAGNWMMISEVEVYGSEAEPEEIVIDVDTTDWTYVDGVETGLWQNDSDPVGTYWYKAGIEDGKYVMEFVFDGELSGTDASFGNGNGTNVRIWFHTALNEAGNPQGTYNSFIDVAYTPSGVKNRFMVNTSETGNSSSAKYGYDDEKPYTVETIVPTALDGLYVKPVFDSIPNCDINEDLDAIFTVSNKPGELANNALYSGNFKTPYSGWDRAEAFNFYEIPAEPEREVANPTGYNYALGAAMKLVGAAATGDPTEVGDLAQNVYKAALNDGNAAVATEYSNIWFGYYYNATKPDISNSFAGTSNDDAGNVGSVVIDLGSEMTWNQVRLHTWAANASGIGAPIAINVFSSTDGETWTYVADMVLGEAGTVYWASTDTEFPEVTSQYVKVDFVWNNGPYAFANEIEVYGDEEPVIPEEPKPIQPETLEELPEGAIALDYAGFVYDTFAEILYAAETTTVIGLTEKDLNYFAVAVVDGETMKVTYFGNTLGRPDGVKSDVEIPAGSYVIIVHGNKTADFAAFAPQVGATVEVYNVILENIGDLKEAAALENAGFTYENPEVVIDVDTSKWTYVDGETVGAWQNTSDPVGSYWYNIGIKDGKYILEVVFEGELTGTAASYGNGNGTNVRIWFHTAKNAAGTKQLTYNSFIDVSYTPDAVLDRFMTNGTTDGNSAAAAFGYDYVGDEKPYTVETIVPTKLDGLYVKLVFDSIPNCVVNEDLDCVFTVSSKPETGNNALYSSDFLKPYQGTWDRLNSVNFYEVEIDNLALALKEENVIVKVDNTTYNAVLNDGEAFNAGAYNNSWFAFTRTSSPIETFEEQECYVGKLVYDFGEAVTWNTVRANMWENAGAGIDTPVAIIVYSSDDNENWTKVGYLKLGKAPVYWAQETFDDVTSRYVKVEFGWTKAGGKAFIMTNEVQVGTLVDTYVAPVEAAPAYLWVKTTDKAAAHAVTYTVPGTALTEDGVYTAIAGAKFENVEGSVAYVNCYVWGVDEEGKDLLLKNADFANQLLATPEYGHEADAWNSFTWTFDTTAIEDEIKKVTFSVGCWDATGTVDVNYIGLGFGDDIIWDKDFDVEYDPAADADVTGNGLGTKGTDWDLVEIVAG